MKEENQSPVPVARAAKLAAISASVQRYPTIPYPLFGQTFPYIPWEWMAAIPSMPTIMNQHLQSVERAKIEQTRQDMEEDSKSELETSTVKSAIEPSTSCSSPKSTSPSSPSTTSSSVIKFSIDDILKRREPQRQTSFLSLASHYPLSKMVKSELEEDFEGDMFKTNSHCDFMDNARYSWLQCTRYRPPKLPRMKKKEGGKKRKLGRNPRVPFTQHQVAALEQKFHRTHYLSSADVAELSTALNLTETRVKIWFQNRRARERRDREGASRSEMTQNKAMTSSVATSFPLPTILTWPSPVAPAPSTLSQFNNALLSSGKSAFKPVS